MKKYTWSEMVNLMREFNERNNIEYGISGQKRLVGYVVYKSSNWPDKDYSLESRTYGFSNQNKAFFPGLGGYSIFAGNMDGTDPCVRIEHIGWEVDYCYFKEDE